jgi:hypothetical protein
MGEIYLDGTEYTDRTVIISPRVGIQMCAVINVRMSHVFQSDLTVGPDRAEPYPRPGPSGLVESLGPVCPGGISDRRGG